jgi:hypothetical protein
MYTIASPLFDSAMVHRPDGEDLVISAAGASLVNKYVQSASLDGDPLDATWFEESDGDELTVEMGPAPNMSWGTGAGAAPPSLSTDPTLDSFGCVADAPDEAEPVATTLTYSGDTRGRGNTVRLAARLADATGVPVEGRAITFTIAGQTLVATTAADGIATVTTQVPGHGKTQHVTASFEGDELFLPSSTGADVTWGGGPH